MISTDNKELAAMQRKQLELLHELDRVTKQIKVRYYLSSGTCLGAVRHQGFIPWDDDIDVYMYWKDAEKLVENKDLFQEKFFIQCRQTDPNVVASHYRLRDSSTSLFLEEELGIDMNHGVFIDIYILYPYPDNRLKARKLILDSFVYRTLFMRKGPQNHGAFARAAGNLVAGLYSGKRRERKMRAVEHEYRHNGGKKYLATYFGRDVTLTGSIVYPRDWFLHPKKLDFEDLKVNCPGDPDAYCILQYGDTYMQLPPEEKRTPHHDFVFADLDTPYTQYKGVYY